LEDVASLITFHGSSLLQQVWIPGFTESYGLRKLRGGQGLEAVPLPAARAAVGNTVQAFNMARASNSEAWHIGICAERAYLFFRRHQREDVVNASFDRQIRILKWILILLTPSQACGQQNESKV